MRKNADRPVVAWVVVGLILSLAYPFVGDGTPRGAVLYNGFELVTVVALLVGIRRNRPERPAGWYVIVAAVVVRLIADVSYEVYRQILHQTPFPSMADVFYVAAIPLLLVGIVMVTRQRSGNDTAGALDAAIITGGLGLVWWVFVVDPIATAYDIPLLERVLTTAYPVLDLLILAVAIRLLTRQGRPTASLALLSAGVVTLLVADMSWQVVTVYELDLEGWASSGYMVSNALWAAAALTRSARDPVPPARVARPRIGKRRMVLLGASTLLVPGLLYTQGLTAPAGGLSWFAIGTGAVVLFVLVIVRMSGFVAQVQRQAGQLEDLALRDALTGLPNRRVFEQRLAEAVEGGGTPQVAVLDLDGFKEVNDRLGHTAGDRMLSVVARRLTGAVREDDLVARLGGDEFAVLLADAGPEAMDAVVGRVTAVLRAPVEVDGYELLTRASIGSADGDGVAEAGELLRRADVAMYAAKGSGSGRHRRFSKELDERAGAEARLGAELRTALDHGQFRLVYQPIVELPEGRVTAVETLVRWWHPERGHVSPAEFIPVAEQNGLIVELGEWILRTACAQAAGWRAELGADSPRYVTVNVSARQLAEPGFPEVVAAALAASGLPASRLVVEVTETAVFGGGQAVQAVQDLHLLGVRIALDDFGTGHSSLGLLQTVPVDILKVDKSFVDNVTRAGRHAVIATALIQVADGLGLSAVAEGVETAEQAAELHRIGYRLAQGYHFGKPVEQPVFRTTPTTAAVRA